MPLIPLDDDPFATPPFGDDTGADADTEKSRRKRNAFSSKTEVYHEKTPTHEMTSKPLGDDSTTMDVTVTVKSSDGSVIDTISVEGVPYAVVMYPVAPEDGASDTIQIAALTNEENLIKAGMSFMDFLDSQGLLEKVRAQTVMNQLLAQLHAATRASKETKA